MEIFPYIFSVLLAALVMWWSRLMATRKPGKLLPTAAKTAPRW